MAANIELVKLYIFHKNHLRSSDFLHGKILRILLSQSPDISPLVSVKILLPRRNGGKSRYRKNGSQPFQFEQKIN